jgi:hypothetical protein
MVTAGVTRGRRHGRDQFNEFLSIVIDSVEVLEDNDLQQLEAVSDDQRFERLQRARSLTGASIVERGRWRPTAALAV